MNFRRAAIGFKGGPVLSIRLSEERLEGLRGALDGSGGWHDIESEDGAIKVDLSEVCYVQVDFEESRVGF